MNRLPLLPLPFLLLGLPTAPAAPPSPEYELLFEDNFDGNRLNEREWMYRVGPRKSGTWINGLNRKENVFLADGNLVVRCAVEEVDGKTENTGGGVISRRTFGYGYYETRCKPFMAGKGVHSAFWQAGHYINDKWDNNNWIFEIDSFEIDSTHWVACNNLYVKPSPVGMYELPWPYRGGFPFKLDPDGWWIDAYEYTPEGVTFYEHGKVVGKAEFPDLPAQQAVWLTALNGVGKVDAAKQPGDTFFDYFRFYARDFPGHNLLPNGDFEYNHDKSPGSPLAWRQEGDADVCRVIKGDSARDAYHLRIGNGKDHHFSMFQRLEFIRNGTYELSAMVKNTGGQTMAALSINGQALSLPAAREWTEVRLPVVEIAGNTADIRLEVRGKAGQVLRIDNIQFKKPVAPGQSPPVRKPFTLVRDPIWQIAMSEPIRFMGDAKFFFVSRDVGFGDAMTLSMVMTADRLANTCPITRAPPTGKNGWAVVLGEDGQLAFRIGSKKDFSEVIAPRAYRPGQRVRVKCVFDRGTARIFLNGRLAAEKSGIPHGIKDSKQAGTFGATDTGFDAVGEVIGGEARKPKGRGRNFSGSIFDLRIHNRAVE